MEQRVTIITLGVSDLARSEDFYSNKLGWEKSEASNDDIIFYQLNGLLISLYPRVKLAEDAKVDSAGQGFSGFTLAHTTRSEKEVDNIFQQLQIAGVNIVKQPEKVFWGGYSGYIADPDGYLWEIAFNPYLQLDKKGNVQ